jgi:dTMP kinase
MFVIIEWIDGSWKSTQIKLIKEKLENLWKKVKLISYPRYNEESSFMVKKYLNWDYGKDIWAKLSSIFYAVDRFDSSFELKADLQNYDYIISDRYVTANMLHQAWKISDLEKRNNFLDWLYDLEYNIFWLPKPDKILFLDVSPEITIKNMVW